MPLWQRPVSIVNARVVTPSGVAASIRFDRRVLALDEPPRSSDVIVDADGALVLPGLINAHDHLELNHYGELGLPGHYLNASAWIADMQLRLVHDPRIRAGRAHVLAARLFIGALKNLLAATTTVAHHNPFYREMRRGLPIRVVRRYGWAHSFLLQHRPAGANGEPGGEIRRRYRATPPDVPFFVHAGEGADPAAAAELPRLEATGCLGANTVLIHGVAFDERDWRDVMTRGASLVWCPASNRRLFGRTAATRRFLDARGDPGARLCLGTDSRLTGSRDLLEELRVAASSAPVTPRELLRMVTTAPADVLRMPDVGRLVPHARADLAVVPPRDGDPAEALLASRRADVRLVVVGGRPLIGVPSFGRAFDTRGSAPRPLVVDGVQHVADAALVRAIARCPIAEPGLVCD